MANNVKDSIQLSYELYKEENENPISKRDYVSINRDFMKYLSAKLLVDGIVKFPERLGYVQVVGNKSKFRVENNMIKGLAPDWAGTKALWESDEEAKNNKQLVYHFNEDTNGVRYRFFWSKSRVLVANKTLYNLRMTRTNKRTLSSNIKNGKEYLIK